MAQYIWFNKKTTLYQNIAIFSIAFLLFHLLYITTLDYSLFYKKFTDAYYLALDKHFFEFIWFFHTKTIGIPILHKFFTIMSASKNVFFIAYIWNILVTYLSFLFILKTLHILFSNKKYLTTITIFSIVLSVVFLPFELWRVTHFDHSNMVLFSILAYGISLLVFDNIHKSLPYVILSLFLLALFHSMAILVMVLIFIFIFIINYLRKTKQLSLLLVCFIFLLSINFLIMTKNYINTGVFSSSTVLGQNLMQRTTRAVKGDDYYNLAYSTNMPKWWIACFYDALKNDNIFKENPNKSYQYNLSIMKLIRANYGYCFTRPDPFTRDSNFVKVKLENIDTPLYVKEVLELDITNLKNKPWIFSGGVSGSNQLFASLYQNKGKRIFLQAWMQYPLNMAYETAITIIHMTRFGGLFPYSYEPQFYHGSIIIKILSIMLSVVLFIGIIVSVILTPIFFYNVYKNYKKSGMLNNFKVFFIIITSLVISLVLLTSIITCCENPRMMVSFFPISTIISIMSYIYLYTNIDKFRALRQKYQMDKKFNSLQSQRIKI